MHAAWSVVWGLDLLREAAHRAWMETTKGEDPLKTPVENGIKEEDATDIPSGEVTRLLENGYVMFPPPGWVWEGDSDDEDEEDAPELYLPGLTLPTMFLPIPNVRYPLFSSLTWWLSKSMINYSARCTVRQTR